MSSNIRIKNIYYMLSYAYQNLKEAGFRNIEYEDFENIHDLLAAILIKGVSVQIKRGLNKDYISYSENLSSLKGKIDFSNSIKHQTLKSKRMVCNYDIFFEDTLHNQILKTTMMLLLRNGDLSQHNKKSIHKILLYFANIRDIHPFRINWSAVSYHRNTATYKMLVKICHLIINGMLLTTTDGRYKMSQFIDEQHMHRLYEKFALGYYIKEHPELSASASYINWDLEDGADKSYLPAMKSDVTLTKGNKTIIIDTKYYSHTMQYNSLYNSTSIISSNLYQICTYVKNKDVGNTGNVMGVLLYAKTDEEITPDNDYVIGGNKISVKTLDLSGSWEDIRAQLDNIVLYFIK